MKMCKLKNNSVESQNGVITTMINIKRLAEPNKENPLEHMQNMLALYELSKIVSEPKYELLEKTSGSILQEFCLLESNNTISSMVKNIVQSAIRLEGEMLVIENPVVEILGEGN